MPLMQSAASSSLGDHNSLSNLLDHLPLFPSWQHLWRAREEPCGKPFAIIPDGCDFKALTVATEAVTGAQAEPALSLIIVMPVRRGLELRPKETYGAIPAG